MIGSVAFSPPSPGIFSGRCYGNPQVTGDLPKTRGPQPAGGAPGGGSLNGTVVQPRRAGDSSSGRSGVQVASGSAPWAARPPSTGRMTPLMKLAWLDSR